MSEQPPGYYHSQQQGYAAPPQQQGYAVLPQQHYFHAPPPSQRVPPSSQGVPPPGQYWPPPGGSYPLDGTEGGEKGAEVPVGAPPPGYPCYPSTPSEGEGGPVGGFPQQGAPPLGAYPSQGYYSHDSLPPRYGYIGPCETCPPVFHPPPAADPDMRDAPPSLFSAASASSFTSTPESSSTKNEKEAVRTGGGLAAGAAVGGVIGIVGGPAGIAAGMAIGGAIGGALGNRSGKRYDERESARLAAKIAVEQGNDDAITGAPQIFEAPVGFPVAFEIVIASDKTSGMVMDQSGAEFLKWSPIDRKIQFMDSQGNIPFALSVSSLRSFVSVKILKGLFDKHPKATYKGTSKLTSQAKVKAGNGDKTTSTLVKFQTMQKENQVWLLDEKYTKKMGSLSFANKKKKALLDLLGGNDVLFMIACCCCYMLDINHGGKISIDN